ncbi:cobalt ECF transporter T component CbiQ [Clostridium sp. MD294]|uniref:cobalt ECF transporter T component CbiQ n=1 Tax=Clostridium sp. MD294 TaxID=97138 RepID=UPI0002CBC02A|nr:cobalt ECF transporter T component CbiQ [Clostridium sp. MD294]NDO47625.1 cobalt ECF transporter T component CbiQ [Clostridium sp. MD294]USF30057.1 Cobalt transport protein CbiQ [Clostridium sp. MD294]
MKKHLKQIDDIAYHSPFIKYTAILKFIFTITIVSLCLYYNNIVISCYIIITMLFINVLKNKINIHDYITMLSIPFVFIFLGCIAIAIEIHFEQHITLYVTKQTIFKSICIMARTFAAVSALYFLTLSTPIYQIVSVFQKLHVPKILTELMYITYRYLFILAEIQHQLKIASMARLGYCDFKTSIKTFSSCITNLLLLSLQKAQQHYKAMEARCYTGELLFLQQEQCHNNAITIKGVIYILSIVLLNIVLKGKAL